MIRTLETVGSQLGSFSRPATVKINVRIILFLIWFGSAANVAEYALTSFRQRPVTP
jgi:hypothetical protein